MVRIFQSILSVLKYVSFVVIGIGFAVSTFLYLIFIATPLFIYRWIVIKIWAPLCGGRDLGKAVNALGNALALEFRNSGDLISPRFTIVVNSVIERHVSYQELYDRIDKKWIRARTETGQLKYPELQQYLSRWMGFMFFRKDTDFRLKNHVKLHTLPETCSDQESHKFMNHLIEKQLNETWTAERSPWEAHIVHNYRNSGLPSRDGKMTLLVFRFHHGISDGLSLIILFLEQLFGNKLEDSSMPQSKLGRRKQSFLRKLWHIFTLPVKTLHGLGLTLALMGKRNTPFHCPDSRKEWWQIHEKCAPISVSKIKVIKNQFRVSFAAVMDSAVGYALGKMMKLKLENGKAPKSITYAIAVPLPNHPKKLRNHAGGLVYEVPIATEMEVKERLEKCEHNLSQVRLYPVVMVFSLLGRAIGGTPIPIEMMLAKNRYVATGMSNLPGTLGQMAWKKRRFLNCDVVAGAGMGCGGIGFFSVSYMGTIQVTAAAEKAILSREELQQIFRWMVEYIEIAYELALEKQEDKLEEDLKNRKNVNVGDLEIC